MKFIRFEILLVVSMVVIVIAIVASEENKADLRAESFKKDMAQQQERMLKIEHESWALFVERYNREVFVYNDLSRVGVEMARENF